MRKMAGAEDQPLQQFFHSFQRNNLSDAELKKFFKTGDLKAFASQMQTQTDKASGGSYARYLAGDDIPQEAKAR